MIVLHNQLRDLDFHPDFPLKKVVFAGHLEANSHRRSLKKARVSLDGVEGNFLIEEETEFAKKQSRALTRSDEPLFFTISCFLRMEVVLVARANLCSEFLNQSAENGYILWGVVKKTDSYSGKEVEVTVPGCTLTTMFFSKESLEIGQGVFARVESEFSTRLGTQRHRLYYEKNVTRVFRSCHPALQDKSNNTSTVDPLTKEASPKATLKAGKEPASSATSLRASRAASLPDYASLASAFFDGFFDPTEPVPKRCKEMRMEDYHFDQIFYKYSAGLQRYYPSQLANNPDILKRRYELAVQGAKCFAEKITEDKPPFLHIVFGGKTPTSSSVRTKRALARRHPYFLIDCLKKNKEAKLVVAVLDCDFFEYRVVDKENNWRADGHSSARVLKDMCPEWRSDDRDCVLEQVTVLQVPFECTKPNAPEALLSPIVKPFEEILDCMKDGLVTICDEVVAVRGSGSVHELVKGLHSNEKDYTGSMRKIFTSRPFCHWFEWNPGYYHDLEDVGSQTGGFMIYHPDSQNSKAVGYKPHVDIERETKKFLKFVGISPLDKEGRAILSEKIKKTSRPEVQYFPLNYDWVQWIKFSTNPITDFREDPPKREVLIQMGKDGKFELVIDGSD